MNQKHRSETILLTGGHAGTTALATIQAMQKENGRETRLVWAGPQYAIEGTSIKTLEFKVFPQMGVECIPIRMGRVQRKFTRHTLTSLIKIPRGFIGAWKIVTSERPKVIMSFGGYAAFPLVVVGWLHRIPIIIHEQTIAIGLSNKLSSFFATKIALSRTESAQFFPQHKVVLTGNPLTEQVTSIPQKKALGSRAVVYITGGSRGSQIINKVVMKALPQILEKFSVIHQTGELDFEAFKLFQSSLSTSAQKHYEVMSFTDPLKMDEVYRRADILIGRSGANTVSEVIALRLPSIFIPIPWTQNNEQGKNAMSAKTMGLAEILKQNELNEEKMYTTLLSVYKNYSKYVNFSLNKDILDREASHNLARLIKTISQ